MPPRSFLPASILLAFVLLLGACTAPTVAAQTPVSVSSPSPSVSHSAAHSEIRKRPSVARNPEITLPYPRLGMWWPDPWEQPLADIARYDWVVLFPEQEEFITPIKTLNPDITLLNATNACELWYDSSPDATPEDNAQVLDIPSEWFLTQVGTSLTQAVDATSTTLHVADLTTTDGIDTYDLFVAGDTALIAGESVRITAVDAGANTLTVERGFVRPASAHNAGVRVAAHITFWPDTWLLNLSTMSPAGIISPTIGPERWADYNARVATELLANPGWNGILLDRADPDQSWLIGASTARTIDPDQSNTLLTDYSAFDASWNEGLRQYESQLRQAVGDDRIIFVNWGMDNYDLLNGNNYEGFPLDDGNSYRSTWHETVLGSIPEIGSYFEWMERGQQPNLTMIETYEDDGGPDPSGDGSYDNPCVQPGFVPNYQKMRFGLATALLNDGFFSYEINTNGHGSLCLLWFDEYDNAGAGRGYLGQPLGPAYQITTISLGPDQLSGSGFESQADLDAWDLWADSDEGYAASASLDASTAAEGSSSVRIDVEQAGGTDWQVSFEFAPVEMTSGSEYTLSFWAKADQERPISTWVQQTQDPWIGYMHFGESLALTTEWQHFELTASADGSDAQAGLYFGLGQVTGSVWLDDVHLQAGSRDVWQRNYEGGTVLVNATSRTHTIDLGAEFRKIDGSQVPAINDGSLVTQVSVPARDGLILLRPAGTGLYLPLVTIAATGDDDVLLSWSHGDAYTAYKVWSAESPYCAPAGQPLQVVSAAPWQFVDDGARGDAAANHYYQVEGVLPNGRTFSNWSGEFDFVIR